MTIAGGGCTTCVERNLHWYSTRVDGGMCSCGAPQSGSDITGLVSPGSCGAGCAVQGGEEAGCEKGALGWSVRRQRRSAPCAWRAAVVLPRIRAQPRAEMMGGKLLGSAAQPGAGCGVRCTRSPATGAGCVGAVCEGAVCAADAISAAPPWCSVVVGSAPREAMMTPRS